MLLIKAMLAEASREEISREEMKVEQLETQIFDKGGAEKWRSKRDQGSFFKD